MDGLLLLLWSMRILQTLPGKKKVLLKPKCRQWSTRNPYGHGEMAQIMLLASLGGQCGRTSHIGLYFQPVHVTANQVTWWLWLIYWWFASPDMSWKSNESDKNMAAAIAVLLVVMKELLVLAVIKTTWCKWQLAAINHLACFTNPHITFFCVWAQQICSLEKQWHLITKPYRHLKRRLNYRHVTKPKWKPSWEA